MLQVLLQQLVIMKKVLVQAEPKIMPIKVFQSSGRGNSATIAQGIEYAYQNGATILNMSFGSYSKSITMQLALENAYAYATLVASAGNDKLCIGPNICPSFHLRRKTQVSSRIQLCVRSTIKKWWIF